MTLSAAPVELPLPRKIGRYTLFDRIGRGGMADIFLAHAQSDLGVSRRVVVKQILSSLAASREFSELLITEAKLSARLDHANVVQVYDLGREDGFLYIAMQYVEGFDLDELLRMCTRTKTPLPVQYALLVIIEALRGLDYAHRRTTDDGRPLGIVHRDVSPSNILISLEGEVKLCDFGIAHANEAIGTYSDDVIKGKAGYMSPEHARGEAIDARADVFAIGIVLWELLAGRRLYRTGNEQGVTLLSKARAAEIPALPSRGLPLEEELHAIVNHALARNRDERYPSAQALIEDLSHYVADAKLVASPLRFGEWLLERFGEQLVEQRRARERAAKALESAEAERALVEPEHSSMLPVGTTQQTNDEVSAELPTRQEAVAVASPSAPPVAAPANAPKEGSVAWRIVALLVAAALVYLFVAHR